MSGQTTFDTSVEQLLRDIDDTIAAVESMRNLTDIQYTPQTSQKGAELHEDKSDLSEISDGRSHQDIPEVDSNSSEASSDKSRQDTSTIDSELVKAAKSFIEKIKNEENFDSENCKKLLDSIEKQIDQIKKKSEEYSKSDIELFKENDQNFIIWQASQYIQTLSILSRDCSELSLNDIKFLKSISDNQEIFFENICEKSLQKVNDFFEFIDEIKPNEKFDDDDDDDDSDDYDDSDDDYYSTETDDDDDFDEKDEEDDEKEYIEKFSSEGVEENQKFIAMAKEFKDNLSPEIEVVDIVDVEGTDHDSDEDYEHDYELTEPQVESEDNGTPSGKKGFFSKLKSKFKKATSRKSNSTSNTNIDDLIEEYDITTMLKEGPKNIKNAANFVLSKNKKNATLSKAMKLLLNDISMVENDFPYFSVDYSSDLEKLKFIERIENCVKEALYSLEGIDKSDENLKKIFILLTSFLREKEDKEINLMKITDDRNKFNEKINEENYLNYEIDVREKALIKRKSKRLFKERIHDKNSDDPRIRRLIKLEKEESEYEEEYPYERQKYKKHSGSGKSTMSPKEKISERKHSIEILCRCLGLLIPEDKKDKKVKYLTPNSEVYRDIEPNANTNFRDYRSKTAPVIKQIETDAGNLTEKDQEGFFEFFNKYIKGRENFTELPQDCISSLKRLCQKRLANNVTFEDFIDDDNDVLKRL